MDDELSRINLEYAAKRASGRLEECRVVALRPGVGEAYKRHCVDAGQREGQFKPLLLQNDADFDFSWWEWLR